MNNTKKWRDQLNEYFSNVTQDQLIRDSHEAGILVIPKKIHHHVVRSVIGSSHRVSSSLGKPRRRGKISDVIIMKSMKTGRTLARRSSTRSPSGHTKYHLK